ncbi:MAG: bifunctional phosphopantothenoylcysteine decarboxylase/phosphopantothenate--cysteine ligase CoaBC [Propionivibrio sp.]|jgi:phosphopantothenoylcysteine decarboxylase/phosphopantothenate--cysteine ligase|uniref:bifunctional phosphopantothenoylcysteine decarboxylase/phosphopantothenate--cysteine ligase CoaBC n=1 Tax=Propionivibrio sp. TaxID=2212460 RepID=UPI001B63DD0E|nr:bifunctional phosphopantothenoylcysteine decarboxylase/phosphopantothenate--cysteine ligase CoaBC [Propionivibrio sp.]MBP7202065.1 bifunctional phosphopantothenoylcysteine decarboxylase/phosphopantothenate--cysteine ligase CoaBC [Propionivibrio sp.]
MELSGKRITLGVTGGIAAYKAAELVRQLVKLGATVRVAMTEAATRFVTPVTFQALSGHPVHCDQWDARVANNMAHIELSREADVILVAPASADFLAKLAHGLADDLLSTLALARNCPLLVAPAMNLQMWNNPATQRNVATLRADGITLLGPASGDQACGEVGLGRMIEPEEIVEDVVAYFQAKHLAGKRVLMTAGPTFEAIDPVRVITNLSSGKMGFALARAAHEAGADVTLVCGPVSQATPRGITRINVASALEMHTAVMQHVAGQDVFIGVAAVADYRPAAPSAQKIKKDGCKAPSIELVQNPDILADVAALPEPPFCVGFAAESQNLAAYAQKKRLAKKIPLIVGNLIQDGFGGDQNKLALFDDTGETRLPPASKIELARALVAHIARLLNELQ